VYGLSDRASIILRATKTRVQDGSFQRQLQDPLRLAELLDEQVSVLSSLVFVLVIAMMEASGRKEARARSSYVSRDRDPEYSAFFLPSCLPSLY
jgi:hypothetical protein